MGKKVKEVLYLGIVSLPVHVVNRIKKGKEDIKAGLVVSLAEYII